MKKGRNGGGTTLLLEIVVPTTRAEAFVQTISAVYPTKVYTAEKVGAAPAPAPRKHRGQQDSHKDGPRIVLAGEQVRRTETLLARGRSQADVCRLLGLSKSTVSQIARGAHPAQQAVRRAGQRILEQEVDTIIQLLNTGAAAKEVARQTGVSVESVLRVRDKKHPLHPVNRKATILRNAKVVASRTR